MTEKYVDARGLDCPQPVLLARNAMLEAGADRVRVAVSAAMQAENIQRMARTEGWSASIVTTGDGIEVLAVRKAPAEACEQGEAGPAPCAAPAGAPARPRVAVFIASDLFGSGEAELGRVLMRAFIKTLKDLRPRPETLIFANSGVRLTTEGSDLIEDLRGLEGGGARIVSCGTCLDYLRLAGKLKVGVASNMYEIATALVNADRVVRP